MIVNEYLQSQIMDKYLAVLHLLLLFHHSNLFEIIDPEIHITGL